MWVNCRVFLFDCLVRVFIEVLLVIIFYRGMFNFLEVLIKFLMVDLLMFCWGVLMICNKLIVFVGLINIWR